MRLRWLAPCAVLVLALGSLAAASRARGEVGLGRSDFRADDDGPAHLARGSACREPAGGRVVSAALLSDELLLELLPPARLGGVSYVVDWQHSTPAYGRFPSSIPRLSGAAEEVLLLAPSAVVVSDYTSGATEQQLAAAGVCVLRMRAPRTFDDLIAQTEELGAATRTEETARALTTSMRRRLAELAAGPQPNGRRRALLVQDPYAYGPRTLQNDCLRRAGLENALEAGKFSATPMLGIEELVSLDPELLFLATDTDVPRRLRTERRPGGPGWAHLSALTRNAAFEIPAAWMASISHHALGACEAYARLARSTP